MTFEIHSNITNRSMTVAARAMRRVLRRKRSMIWAIFGWTVFFINALLLIPFDGEPFALDVRTVTSLLAEVMLLSVLLFQDRFNGMIARKNTLAGTKEYHVAFGEDSYTRRLQRFLLRIYRSMIRLLCVSGARKWRTSEAAATRRIRSRSNNCSCIRKDLPNEPLLSTTVFGLRDRTGEHVVGHPAHQR